MGKKIALPSREEMFKLLSGSSNDSDLQYSIRIVFQKKAGAIMDANEIACLFIVAVMSHMANVDEMMRGFVNKRTCEQIDIMINDKEISDEAKRIFVEKSIISNY